MQDPVVTKALPTWTVTTCGSSPPLPCLRCPPGAWGPPLLALRLFCCLFFVGRILMSLFSPQQPTPRPPQPATPQG